MGKRGSWFTSIKRVFISNSKEKGTDEKSSKEKKGIGKLRYGDKKHSFIRLFREPSSIEEILEDVEEHLIDFKPLAPFEIPKAHVPAPRAASTPRTTAAPGAQGPPTLGASHPRTASSLPIVPSFPPRVTASSRPQGPPDASSAAPSATASIPQAPIPPPAATPVKAVTLPNPLLASPVKSGTLPEPVSTPPAAPLVNVDTLPREVSVPPVNVDTLPREVSVPPAAPPSKAPTLQKTLSTPSVTPSVNADNPPRPASPRVVHKKRAEPTLKDQHNCATKIQAMYKGHVARRSYRALKGIVRLQNVMKGQAVKRQTTSAMRSMQLLVRVQSQIQSRRIQMLENHALQRQALEGPIGKNVNQMEEWDDSMLTKEEMDARTQRKYEAIVKRERGIAYAYSHQIWKGTPTTSRAALIDMRTGGFPWWWNSLDHRVTSVSSPMPAESTSTKNSYTTPPRQAVDLRASPLPRVSNQRDSSPGCDSVGPATPRSTRSLFSSRNRLTKASPGREFPLRYPRSRATGADSPFKDNDSLTSCPAFSIPHYMEPTTSAIAKVRGSPTSADELKRRIASPLAQGIRSLKWSKGSPFGSKESGTTGQHRRSPSVQSMDSSASMPAVIGRKPFNRFV